MARHPICYLQAFVIPVHLHKKQLRKQRRSSMKMHKKNVQNNLWEERAMKRYRCGLKSASHMNLDGENTMVRWLWHCDVVVVDWHCSLQIVSWVKPTTFCCQKLADCKKYFTIRWQNISNAIKAWQSNIIIIFQLVHKSFDEQVQLGADVTSRVTLDDVVTGQIHYRQKLETSDLMKFTLGCLFLLFGVSDKMCSALVTILEWI